MGKLVFTAAILIGAVTILGVAIDVQSRAPVNRPQRVSPPPTIFAAGRIEGASPEIDLRPQVTGQIVRILTHEGQVVNAGDILIQLDDQQYVEETALASAELALAEAQLERLVNGAHPQERNEAVAACRAREAELQGAEISWRRVQGLLNEHAISQQEADNAWTQVTRLRNVVEAARARVGFLTANARTDDVRIQQARVNATKARLALAKVHAERTALRAPLRAEVLKINGRIGELVGPSTPEPAVILADTSTYYVRAFVEELDAPRVEVGMPAEIAVDGLGKQKLRGRVVRLSPRMEDKSLWNDRPTERHDPKTREVWIVLETKTPLVIGLRADVTIDAKPTPPPSLHATSSQQIPAPASSPRPLQPLPIISTSQTPQ